MGVGAHAANGAGRGRLEEDAARTGLREILGRVRYG